MPTTNLQPGSTDAAAVKALQDYLVQSGYLTEAKKATGYGTYGPATTAAVAALQKDLGVDNSSGVGYFGPRTIAAINAKGAAGGDASVKAIQAQLGLPQTGLFDEATSTAYSKAITSSLTSNPDTAALLGSNDPAAILNAYTTGDWSGVTTLTGKPFTDEQQQAAVAQADAALAPAYKAQESYDTAGVEDALRGDQEGFQDSQAADRKQFGADKDALDQNSADNGVLFSGSRVQKLNDLRNTYADREAIARRNASENIGGTTRAYQYQYGDDAAKKLSNMYALPGASSFDANRAGGPVTPSKSLSSVYDPNAYSFQGTAPVAQKAQVQTRAASLLANKANKLSLSGVGAKF